MEKKRARIVGGAEPGEYDRTELDATGLEAPLDPSGHPLDATVSPKFKPAPAKRDEQPKEPNTDDPGTTAKRGRGKGAAHK